MEPQYVLENSDTIIRVLRDSVLLEFPGLDEEAKSSGGLILPVDKSPTAVAVVRGYGPDVSDCLKRGDRVIIGRNKGTRIEVCDLDLRVVPESQCLGLILDDDG